MTNTVSNLRNFAVSAGTDGLGRPHWVVEHRPPSNGSSSIRSPSGAEPDPSAIYQIPFLFEAGGKKYENKIAQQVNDRLARTAALRSNLESLYAELDAVLCTESSSNSQLALKVSQQRNLEDRIRDLLKQASSEEIKALKKIHQKSDPSRTNHRYGGRVSSHTNDRLKHLHFVVSLSTERIDMEDADYLSWRDRNVKDEELVQEFVRYEDSIREYIDLHNSYLDPSASSDGANPTYEVLEAKKGEIQKQIHEIQLLGEGSRFKLGEELSNDEKLLEDQFKLVKGRHTFDQYNVYALAIDALSCLYTGMIHGALQKKFVDPGSCAPKLDFFCSAAGLMGDPLVRDLIIRNVVLLNPLESGMSTFGKAFLGTRLFKSIAFKPILNKTVKNRVTRGLVEKYAGYPVDLLLSSGVCVWGALRTGPTMISVLNFGCSSGNLIRLIPGVSSYWGPRTQAVVGTICKIANDLSPIQFLEFHSGALRSAGNRFAIKYGAQRLVKAVTRMTPYYKITALLGSLFFALRNYSSKQSARGLEEAHSLFLKGLEEEIPDSLKQMKSWRFGDEKAIACYEECLEFLQQFHLLRPTKWGRSELDRMMPKVDAAIATFQKCDEFQELYNQLLYLKVVAQLNVGKCDEVRLSLKEVKDNAHVQTQILVYLAEIVDNLKAEELGDFFEKAKNCFPLEKYNQIFEKLKEHFEHKKSHQPEVAEGLKRIKSVLNLLKQEVGLEGLESLLQYDELQIHLGQKDLKSANEVLRESDAAVHLKYLKEIKRQVESFLEKDDLEQGRGLFIKVLPLLPDFTYHSFAIPYFTHFHSEWTCSEVAKRHPAIMLDLRIEALNNLIAVSGRDRSLRSFLYAFYEKKIAILVHARQSQTLNAFAASGGFPVLSRIAKHLVTQTGQAELEGLELGEFAEFISTYKAYIAEESQGLKTDEKKIDEVLQSIRPLLKKEGADWLLDFRQKLLEKKIFLSLEAKEWTVDKAALRQLALSNSEPQAVMNFVLAKGRQFIEENRIDEADRCFEEAAKVLSDPKCGELFSLYKELILLSNGNSSAIPPLSVQIEKSQNLMQMAEQVEGGASFCKWVLSWQDQLVVQKIIEQAEEDGSVSSAQAYIEPFIKCSSISQNGIIQEYSNFLSLCKGIDQSQNPIESYEQIRGSLAHLETLIANSGNELNSSLRKKQIEADLELGELHMNGKNYLKAKEALTEGAKKLFVPYTGKGLSHRDLITKLQKSQKELKKNRDMK